MVDAPGSVDRISDYLTLTPEDYVAFPYGRDVVSGAKTEEATVDALYGW